MVSKISRKRQDNGCFSLKGDHNGTTPLTFVVCFCSKMTVLGLLFLQPQAFHYQTIGNY